MNDIKAVGSLKGTISNSGSLTGRLSVPERVGMGTGETYSGSYEVVPRAFDEQVLNTANRLLEKNVIVHPVPYWETSNLSNGKTVYIAEEI